MRPEEAAAARGVRAGSTRGICPVDLRETPAIRGCNPSCGTGKNSQLVMPTYALISFALRLHLPGFPLPIVKVLRFFSQRLESLDTRSNTGAGLLCVETCFLING